MSPRHAHTLGLVLPLVAVTIAATLAASGPQSGAATPGATTITVEGCLTKEGRRGTSVAAEQFVLVIGPAAGSATSPATTAQTGGVVPAPPQRKMYALRSADEAPVEFTPVVNHRVRVTGVSTASATTAPLGGRSPEATPYQAPVATPSAASGATGTPFDSANLPTLVVRTITSLARTCQ